jgi:hypothetical protein
MAWTSRGIPEVMKAESYGDFTYYLPSFRLAVHDISKIFTALWRASLRNIMALDLYSGTVRLQTQTDKCQ